MKIQQIQSLWLTGSVSLIAATFYFAISLFFSKKKDLEFKLFTKIQSARNEDHRQGFFLYPAFIFFILLILGWFLFLQFFPDNRVVLVPISLTAVSVFGLRRIFSQTDRQDYLSKLMEQEDIDEKE